jgi:hypothetical protein
MLLECICPASPVPCFRWEKWTQKRELPLHEKEVGKQKEVGTGRVDLSPGSSLSLKGSSTSVLLALASLSQLGIT